MAGWAWPESPSGERPRQWVVENGPASPATVVAEPSSPSGSPSSQGLSPAPSGNDGGGAGAALIIEHRVTKMDTLAGVAIKYGVEVADIKRLNNLSTDLQMFAHKSLRIPCPGRHPPSPTNLSNGSHHFRDETTSRLQTSKMSSLHKQTPPEHKVSASMSLLQDFYGLAPLKTDPKVKATEMVAYYNKGKSKLPFEDKEPWFRGPYSEPVPSKRWKPPSLTGTVLFDSDDGLTDGGATANGSDSERLTRRRLKPDVRSESSSIPSEQSGGSGASGFVSRIMNHSQQNLRLVADSILAAGGLQSAVRRSVSTPDFQESKGSGSSSSIWPPSAGWHLKPDAFALPRFDGIPNPISAWRNKAAKD